LKIKTFIVSFSLPSSHPAETLPILSCETPLFFSTQINCMKQLYFVFTLAFFLLCQPLFSQVTIFMKITDENNNVIEGESQSKAYPKSVEVDENASAIESCGTSACKASVKDVTFQFPMNKAVIALRKTLLRGEHLNKVEIFYQKSGGATAPVTYARMVMETVFVSSITESSSSGEQTKMQVTFNPGQIGWAYSPQNPDGSPGKETKYGWDITKNMEWLSF